MADKQITVCLSFDFDAISLWLGGLRLSSLSAISRGEFGRIGAERLLAMLRDWRVRSTWFVPGHSAETFPDIINRVIADGHEVANHGYMHLRARNAEDEAALLDRASDVLKRITGVRAVGYRAPRATLTDSMVGLLRGRGFLYDSSLIGNDFSPYYMRIGDVARRDGPYTFGKPVDVVEVPFSWGLDDFPVFEHRAGVNPGLASPEAVYQIWAGDFDYLYDRLGEGIYTLTLHPQVIGRGHRLLMLDRLMSYIRAHDGVEFRTMSDAVVRWKLRHPLHSCDVHRLNGAHRLNGSSPK